MIPIPMNIPWRLIGYGIAVAAILLAGWRVSVWHDSHGKLRATEARLAAEEACEEGSKCSVRVAQAQTVMAEKNAEAATQYEQEIARLNARPVKRGVIRVCPDPGAVRDAAGPGQPAGAETGGVLRGAVEFDTGPLRELVREAAGINAAYRALRERDEALAAE